MLEGVRKELEEQIKARASFTDAVVGLKNGNLGPKLDDMTPTFLQYSKCL